MLSHPASYITHDILRLPSHGVIPRYTKILLAFFISGIIHTAIDATTVTTWAESKAISLFVTQAIGIILEDSVQAVWKRLVGGIKTTRVPKGRSTLSLWKRIVGYMWVLTLLALSTPT